MNQEDPSITVLIKTIDQKEVEWNYDRMTKAFPEIIDKVESKFDGYKGHLHIHLPLSSLTIKYLDEIFLTTPKSDEINFHAIDVCLRELADHSSYGRIVRELLTKTITCLNLKNCISIWRLCRKFDHYQTRKLERYLTYNLVENISHQSICFYRLSIDELTYLISSDFLHVKSENDVVTLIDNYIKADERNRTHLYPVLYALVRTRFLHVNSLSPSSLPLLETHGDQEKRRRIHRDILVMIGGTVGGAYMPYPAYFDHDSSKWRESRQMQLPAPMVYHAVIVLNGLIYAFGGGDTSEAYSKKMWRYEGGNWKRCADMHEKRANMGGMVVIYQNRIYVFGGNQHFVTRLATCECYDPVQDSWTQLPDMPHQRADAAAVVVGDVIYVSGGLTHNRVLAEMDAYLPKEREWRGAGNLAAGFSGHCLTAEESADGSYLISYGGYTGKDRITSVFKKKLPDGKWGETPKMNTPRSSASLVPFGRNEFFIFGGNNGRGAFAERFNGECWEVIPTSSTEREGARVVLVPDFYHEV
ncbi:hypothetical protein PFISCL1PPCAC_2447, partial [Pristionchus fissidentatus]